MRDMDFGGPNAQVPGLWAAAQFPGNDLYAAAVATRYIGAHQVWHPEANSDNQGSCMLCWHRVRGMMVVTGGDGVADAEAGLTPSSAT